MSVQLPQTLTSHRSQTRKLIKVVVHRVIKLSVFAIVSSVGRNRDSAGRRIVASPASFGVLGTWSIPSQSRPPTAQITHATKIADVQP